jgi:hypothetical protein
MYSFFTFAFKVCCAIITPQKNFREEYQDGLKKTKSCSVKT